MHISQHSTNHGDELSRYSAEGKSALKQQDENQLSSERIAAWLETHPVVDTDWLYSGGDVKDPGWQMQNATSRKGGHESALRSNQD